MIGFNLEPCLDGFQIFQVTVTGVVRAILIAGDRDTELRVRQHGNESRVMPAATKC